jgi:hypothetical protein
MWRTWFKLTEPLLHYFAQGDLFTSTKVARPGCVNLCGEDLLPHYTMVTQKVVQMLLDARVDFKAKR